MQRTKSFAILLLTILPLVWVAAPANALPSPASSTQQIDGIAAIVNDSVITTTELNDTLKRARKQVASQNLRNPPSDDVLRQSVLDSLINQKLQLQIAKRADITATEAQVTKAIAQVAKQNHMTVAQLMKKVESNGFTEKSYRDAVKNQIILSQTQVEAVGRTVSISESDITNAMKPFLHKANASRKYRVADIILPNAQAANSTLQALRKGQPIDKVTQGNYTDLGWRAIDDLPDLFTAKIKQMKVGNYAGPIQAPNGYHVIALLGKRGKAGKMPSRDAIRQMVYGQKMQKAIVQWIDDLKEKSYIKIMS